MPILGCALHNGPWIACIPFQVSGLGGPPQNLSATFGVLRWSSEEGPLRNAGIQERRKTKKVSGCVEVRLKLWDPLWTCDGSLRVLWLDSFPGFVAS